MRDQSVRKWPLVIQEEKNVFRNMSTLLISRYELTPLTCRHITNSPHILRTRDLEVGVNDYITFDIEELSGEVRGIGDEAESWDV